MMKDEIYKTPEASLQVDSDSIPNYPSPFLVGFWLVLITLVAALVMSTVEYFIEKSIPGANALTTILPAFLVGSIYGGKIGVLFPAKLRHLSILAWFLYSFFITGGVVLLFGWELLVGHEVAKIISSPMFIAIFLGAVLFAYIISYFVFKSGEKAGIKKFEKENKI